MAVDKPAGVLVHPTRPGGPRTLWDGLRDLLGYELLTGGQVSIINRLDRETSGVVVVAKTADAARLAAGLMESRAVEKVYEALVFGWPVWEERRVDAPILRRGTVEKSPVYLERAAHPRGAPASTSLRVLARGTAPRGTFARIEARPHTGRTHQIRVHLAHTGHPVLGDKLYAKGPQPYLAFIESGWTARLEECLWMPRHALHCRTMALAGRVWQAPVPPDMAAWRVWEAIPGASFPA